MAVAPDQDTVFLGVQKSSRPKHTLEPGEVSRLINARFVEGAITNHLAFDTLDIKYVSGKNARPYGSAATYEDILKRGDIQLFAPMQNVGGNFIVSVISGILFIIDVDEGLAYDITPKNAFLPETSNKTKLSYIDNDGGVYGVGGYLVIFNDNNRPIFINHNGARISSRAVADYEMPPARLGVTAGNRAGIISGSNILWFSDPLGGDSALAPLTFQETLESGSPYYTQIFTIGSALDMEEVTAMCRLPKFGGAAQDFLAQTILISTKRHKFIVVAGQPRADWENTNFIIFAGTNDGIAGPHACTNIGSSIVYISYTGRIKNIAQDEDRDNRLAETFLDDNLGQYLSEYESSFHYRDWYTELDHSNASVKFVDNRIFATVYPERVTAIDKYNLETTAPTHRALAVGSLDSTTLLSERAEISWEGFYDFLHPIGLAVLDEDFYVASKNEWGINSYHKLNKASKGSHASTIYTRGYFASSGIGYSTRSLTKGSLYFRELSGTVNVAVWALYNGDWNLVSSQEVSTKLHKFKAYGNKFRTDAPSIPLKIVIDHKGCHFELESIRVEGEVFVEN